MFKFGFLHSDNEEDDKNKTDETEWFEAIEIEPIVNNYKYIEQIEHQQFNCRDVKLKYISSNNVIDHLKQTEDTSNCVLRAETDHSDLVTGEYEGGLKIWECTTDLINFLTSENIEFKNKNVLDLGCGAGMLGLFTLLKEARVDFQDYNKEVIEHTTIPNALLNAKNNDKLNSCKFYAGDWKSFMNLTTSKYDYILTSETIYNPDNYQKLHDLFTKLLVDNGIVYLAAKTYYFGVGGGIRQFEETLKRNNKLLSTVCWRQAEGVQREILKICKK